MPMRSHSNDPDILVFVRQAREQIEKLARGIEISENSEVEMTLFLLESAEEEALTNQVVPDRQLRPAVAGVPHDVEPLGPRRSARARAGHPAGSGPGQPD